MGFGDILLTAVGTFFVARAQAQEKGAKKTVEINTENGKVKSRVCIGDKCRETELYRFEGNNKEALAAQAAAKLTEIFGDGNQFNGRFRLSEDKNEIVYDLTRVLLGSEVPRVETKPVFKLNNGASGIETKDGGVDKFFRNIAVSGVFPTNREVAAKRLKDQEPLFPFFQYPDVQLPKWLDEASNLFARGDNVKAEEVAQEIIDYTYPRNARPFKASEAVFLVSDMKRIEGMREWGRAHFDTVMTILKTNYAKVMPREGYLVRFNYEMLRTCAIYREQFGDDAKGCSEAEAEEYYQNATAVYNTVAPTFDDNYLAAKTFLAMARYKLASGKQEDLARADREFDRTLNLAALIRRPSAAATSNNVNQQLLIDTTFHDDESAVADVFGYKTGLWYFGVKAEISRALRVAAGTITKADQFNPGSFNYYEALAFQGKAEVERRKSSFSLKPGEHFEQAEKYLAHAVGIMEKYKKGNIADFYSDGKIEERQAYFDLAADYAEISSIRASFTGKPWYVDRAKQTAQEIVDYYLALQASDRTPQSLVDVTYLKAASVLAGIEEQNRNTLDRAKIRYSIIAANIDEYARTGHTITPYLHFLKAKAVISGARIDLRVSKGVADVSSKILEARDELAQARGMKTLARLCDQNEAELYAMEGEKALLLFSKTEDQNKKEVLLKQAQAALEGLELHAQDDNYYVNYTKIMMARLVLRMADYYEMSGTQKLPDDCVKELAGIVPLTLIAADNMNALKVMRKTAFNILDSISNELGGISAIAAVEKGAIVAQSSGIVADVQAQIRGLKLAVETLQANPTDYFLAAGQVSLAELLSQAAGKSSSAGEATAYYMEAQTYLSAVSDQHKEVKAKAILLEAQIATQQAGYMKNKQLYAVLKKALLARAALNQGDVYLATQADFIIGELHMALARRAKSHQYYYAAKEYFNKISDRFIYLKGMALCRQIEIDLKLTPNRKLDKDMVAHYAVLVQEVQGRLKEVGIADDDYLSLNLMGNQAVIRIMQEQPKEAIEIASSMLEILGENSDSPLYYETFRYFAKVKGAQALIAFSEDKNYDNSEGSLDSAIGLLKQVETSLGEPLPYSIYRELLALPAKLDAIDKASKEAGTALITKDVPDAMFSLSPIIAIIKERYSENSALYNLVNSAQEEDPGTAKETINRAIEELKKKDGTLYQYSLGRGITWDSHTLIAELYYTMTIAFAIKDKKYLKLDESPRTFWYAKSAIEEYKQTEFTPYLFRRINDVLSLIPPPPKAVEKKERTE